MERITVNLIDDIDEKRLMSTLTCIIEEGYFRDQLPNIMPGVTPRSWQLDSHNDWFATLVRKGEKLRIDEPPLERDTLEVRHRYWREPLDAIKPWLEYRYGYRS